MAEEILSPLFKKATADLVYLLDRGYPVKQVVELAGNRYRLSSVQRSVLRRGIAAADIAGKRKAKFISANDVAGQSLSIDSCNVIAVVGNYLNGFFVYLAADGAVRDAAESGGVFRDGERRRKVVRLVVNALADLKPDGINFYIDEPHAHSRDLAGELREELRLRGRSAEIKLVRSADRVLKNVSGILASGDSEIIDAVERVFDLARYILEKNFDINLPEAGSDIF